MQFVAGLIIGAIVGGALMCILAYKKINHAYMEGYNAGQEGKIG